MADDFWSGYNYSIPGSESTLNLTSKREHQQRCCTRERISHIFEAGRQMLVKLYPSGHKWKLNAPFEGPWQYSWGECQSQTDVDITRFLLIDNIKNLETNNSFKQNKKQKLITIYQNIFQTQDYYSSIEIHMYKGHLDNLKDAILQEKDQQKLDQYLICFEKYWLSSEKKLMKII